MMDLEALQRMLRQFAADRGWDELNTPKNLSTALMVEAAELAEIFQWMSPEASRQTHNDPTLHDAVSDEVADVFIYLLQMADRSSVDLKRAVGRKLQKNAQKYPPTRNALPLAPPVEEVRTHVFVDFENCQPDEHAIRELVPNATDVLLFHGPNQKDRLGTYQSFGERFKSILVKRRGNNSLDFHLTFHMGYAVARSPTARFVVISNDKGYAPMIGHAAEQMFDVRLIGFGAAPPPPPKPKATKKTAPAPAAKKAAKTPRAMFTLAKQRPEAPTPTESMGKKVLAALRKMKAKAALPGKGTALQAHVKDMVAKQPGAKADAVLSWLQQKGHCQLKPDGTVEYKL